MINKVSTILLLMILFSGCSSKEDKGSHIINDDKNYKVIAYLTCWQDNWGNNFEKANQITHINYAFANIKNGQVILGSENDADDLKKLNTLKEVNPSLKILISVGGWGWSGNFSDAFLTKNSRQLFANSAIDFMLKHKIDGVDLDWEYPGLIGAGNIYRAEDKENFTAILLLLRKKMDSINANQKYLLTIATGASQNYLDHTNMREAQKYLDFINIMTYDFYTGSSKNTGHHANLSISKYANQKRLRSAFSAVQQHVDAGIPINKIVLGVPFYGRWWNRVNPGNNGLYQSAKGTSGTYTYAEISDSLNSNNGYLSHWDNSANAPYIWRQKDSLFITYENARSIELKANFVKNKQLGGIMFWQMNADNGTLLEAVYNNLN